MMDSELKIILGFLYNRCGKEVLSPSELYLPLSIELKWFNPNQAKDIINLVKYLRSVDMLIEQQGLPITPIGEEE